MANKVIDFKVGETIDAFLMIKMATLKITVNQKKYMDFNLVDNSGEINAKLWELPADGENLYGVGQLVKVRGIVSEWKGSKQLKVSRIRLANENDEVRVEDYVQSAPDQPEFLYDFIMSYIENLNDVDLKKITKEMIEKNKEKIMYYPAAQSNHHAIRSGLMYHVKRMLLLADKMCEVYESLNRDLLISGVILHDIAKIDEMNADEFGQVTAYTTEGNLLGHIILGIQMIGNTGSALGLDQDKIMALQHMILSHHSEPEYGSPKRPMFPEAEMLHYLDMVDARMYDMEKALNEVDAGEFTNKIWTMENRKLYKNKF